jgi:nucleotide-binding universal stress UspA family protein
LRPFPSQLDGKLRTGRLRPRFTLLSMAAQTPERRTKSTAGQTGSPGQVPTRVFTNILCAVDGTRPSTAAVRMATCLAGPEGHLTLLAVTAVSGSGVNRAAAISPSRVQGVLSRAERIAEEAGVPSKTVVDPGGPPVEAIFKRASHHDLLAIGAPASSWLGGMLIGGVAAGALSRFTTPMLVVRAPFAGSLHGRRILVASDGGANSDHIVELAGRLGLSQGAQVTLVNALGAESKMNPRGIQAQARALELMLPDASGACIEPGKPRDVILNAATGTKAAMIVMGSRRLGGLRAFGSVSRRVVHDAPCSVLLLPPDTDTPAQPEPIE